MSALGKAAVSAGSAGAIGAGTNAAIQAASKGITNVDGKEAALAGVKSAAVAFVYSGLGSLAKGSGAGQSLYDSKGSPSPGSAVQDKTADVGRKLDYMFGKATGSTHNLNRTVQMQGQLSRIGLFDNDAGRSYIEQQMNNVLNDPTSIVRVQENGRILRQSLLTGPNGALDMETVWEGSKLITVNLFGKEINWFS